MARNRARGGHDPLTTPRTRTSAAWVSAVVAVIFLILLIIFIAQNNRKVPLHFFTASGHVSLALALLVAAVAGALVTALVAIGRMLQLRLAAHRHNRAIRRAAQPAPAPAGAPAAPQRDLQQAQPEQAQPEQVQAQHAEGQQRP